MYVIGRHFLDLSSINIKVLRQLLCDNLHNYKTLAHRSFAVIGC
jgi:hypothetical protein